MNTDTPVARNRPRPWLLVALGIAVAAFLVTRMWSGGSAAVQTSSSNQGRTQAKDPEQRIDPAELNVRLEALEAPRPERGSVARNPFRFQPTAPPAPPPDAYRPPTVAPGPTLPPQPAGPPPIPLKFMGVVEMPNGVKMAALSDCKASTFNALEGAIVDGQYRVVKIGIESLVIEYVSGKGRTTLRREGCPPR
jgi:hypothetical protein